MVFAAACGGIIKTHRRNAAIPSPLNLLNPLAFGNTISRRQCLHKETGPKPGFFYFFPILLAL